MTTSHAHLRLATQAPAPQHAPVPDAAPFLKWAGGKTRLLAQLEPLMPERFGRYFEPFLGGGAVYFRLQPHQARLSDVNGELINVYRCVRDQVDALIEDLSRHRYDKNHYYAVRAQDPARLPDVARAARMIFLNRTCFNGLYRVNRRGRFNVPFGRYKNPTICDRDRLRAASEALQGADIRHVDYAASVKDARSGDFVYFDPPYMPISETANFTSYTAGAFGLDQQVRLRDVFADLASRGVRAVLSNSDTPVIRELYRDFHIDTVTAPRAISRSANGRKAVSEVVVRTW